ncbi:MAG: glutamate-1-semialdehyde 2,1-aminomutase [Alteromonadaceae bacterium]|jgi:glutamate-1-semialdehyde 2,1-aminomutase
MNYDYPKSKQYLKRAEKVIPLGSQTFSKSKLCYPQGASPHFITKGQGANVWDLDGNQYIDFVSGLLSVNLGYQDPDVNAAVIDQLNCGVNFSLSHPIEAEVAELMIDLIPCAQMVRFGKNGSDATSAAIRLSRAYTKREKVAVCGYHGWHDWYIGSTTRDAGVPESVKALTLKFDYNDIDSLQQLFEQNPDNIAAIILEPMNLHYPKDDFLGKVRALATKHGAVLIFDEMITGFRYDLGGAQKLFNVTPDLATFGKSLANGFALSAVVGSKEIMQWMEEIFFSGTFGGEALSLAAAKATLLKLKSQDVLGHTHRVGQIILDTLPGLISKHQMDDYCYICGHPSWSLLIFKANDKYTPEQLKTYMQQEQLARGLMINGSHNLNFAHTEEDINYLLQCYDEILPRLKALIDKGELEGAVKGEFIQPVFKVR